MRFYFSIKYINKASAGDGRSMCTDSHPYTHTLEYAVCGTQTYKEAYNSQRKFSEKKKKKREIKL